MCTQTLILRQCCNHIKQKFQEKKRCEYVYAFHYFRNTCIETHDSDIVAASVLMGAFYGRRRFILAFLITVTFTFDQVTQKLFSPNGSRDKNRVNAPLLSYV